MPRGGIEQEPRRFCSASKIGNCLNDNFLIFDATFDAARLQGELGPEARQAVPVLMNALENGPNDIDTGDGILAYRSTIALALGKIQDPAAIPVLLKELGVNEKASLLSSLSTSDQRTGVGHEAIVEALGLFGPQAQSEVPQLEKMVKESSDENLKRIIQDTLEMIKGRPK